MADKDLSIAFRLDFWTQFKALRALPHKRLAKWLSYIVFVAGPAVLLLVAQEAGIEIVPKDAPIPLPRLLFLGVIFVFIAIPLLQALGIYLVRRKRAGEITYAMSEEGLKVTAESFEATHKWSQLLNVRETKQFFFLYIEPRVAYVLPKAALHPEQEAQARNLFATHLGCQAITR